MRRRLRTGAERDFDSAGQVAILGPFAERLRKQHGGARPQGAPRLHRREALDQGGVAAERKQHLRPLELGLHRDHRVGRFALRGLQPFQDRALDRLWKGEL